MNCPKCGSEDLQSYIQDGEERTHCNTCGENDWSSEFAQPSPQPAPAGEGTDPATWLKLRAAERLADEVANLVVIGKLNARSAAADALLDYRDPPRSERSDRLSDLEQELAALRTAREADAAELKRLRGLKRDLHRIIASYGSANAVHAYKLFVLAIKNAKSKQRTTHHPSGNERNVKLWFFRTDRGYYLANFAATKADVAAQGRCGVSFPWSLHVGNRRPSGFPNLAKGQCVPVTLLAEGEGE